MSRKTRKLIWSVPVMAVLAIAGALAMFAAQGPAGVSAYPLPGAPANLTVEAADGDAGRTTLVLNWDAAADAAGYRIDIADEGAVWETMTMDTGSTATTYTDDTLTASDIRWYRVFAVNSHGVGPVSNAISGSTDAKVNPGSVMNLMATPNAKNPRKRLDLSWDAPAEDGGEMIVGYEIQAHVGGVWQPIGTGVTQDQVTVVTKTSYADATDRDPGDSQLYRVRAVNGTTRLTATAANAGADASADDDASEEWVQVTGTTQAATAPGQVTGLTAVNTNTAGTEISLYWYDPEETGGWNISGYVIQAHRHGKKFPSAPTIANIEAATFGTTAPTLGDTANPDNATWYQEKSTTPSNTQAIFPGIVPAGTPAVQQRWYFRVYAVTTDNGPDNTDGNADDVFRRSAAASNTASDKAEDRLTLDHDNDPNTTALDPLAPLETLTATTGDSAKKQQIDLSITVATSLSGATPPVQQIAYRIDYSEDAGLSWKLLERDTRFTGFSESRNYEDDDGLAFDETRSYRVFAIGSSSTDVGPPSAIATGATQASGLPKGPTGVTASSPTLQSIQASWTAPQDNGGQPIVKYLVQWAQDDGDDVAEAADFLVANPNVADATEIYDDTTDDASTMASFEIPEADALDDDTVYAFRVAAVNKNPAGADRPATDTIIADGTDGAPNWSDPVLFNTTDAAKPSAVEGLTSERATDASGAGTGVNLLWNKPSDDIMISSYDIEVQDSEGDWANPTSDAEDASANKTSYTDPDEPEAGEMRKYRVRASNGAGDGPWTEVYYPRDPADDHTHAPVALTKPQNVMASSDASGTLNLTWDAVAGADRYILIAVDMSGATDAATGLRLYETAAEPGTSTMGNVTNLVSGRNYLGIVVAVKGSGATQETEYAFYSMQVTVQ